ncbi:MAG TPA: gliding motility-associated C-terminal domain-containing protein [Puia sp.]|nr:gliding motility-associated C-terminal domain-containing protein [Puia sp.]
MKGSFIIVFILVEFIALVNGSDLRAQNGRPHVPVVKNNFTGFTRKNTNRGKLWMARNKAYMRHPDAGFADEYSPNSKAVELFEKRTIDSKFYINKDTPSIFYSQRSSSPMHFKKNGEWITIDTRLSPKGPLLYEASNQQDAVGFDVKRKSSYIITSEGRTYFNNWKLYGQNGSTSTLLATANWTNYTAGDDGIAIKNIFPGIDAEMKVSKGSVKTSFIVHANKFSKYKTLLFRDSFLNGHAGSFTFSNGLSGNGLISAVDFRVNALSVFRIKEGIMYQKENPSSTWQFIPYYIDHNNLTLAIHSDFLNTRNGDVIIDPLVQSTGILKMDSIAGSHSNQTCNLDTACKYNFLVPAPAQAKIIDATFSFEFTANAPCVGQDGAFSFTINNGCTSQNYVGTATGAGAQNFPNQRIILNNGSGVASCFPAPVCGPQNIPFTFNFYRTCHGPTGCDGTCIGASKDLTITLVGRTLDSASLTASPLTSCAGAQVTLTARGYFGVAPYSFVWQGLPQFNGDSVIKVNPDSTTVYTVQVNDTCPGGGGPITKSISVNVLAKLPAPTFTSNSPVCAGSQLILSAPAMAGTTYFIQNPTAGLGGGHYDSTAVFPNVTPAYSGTWIAVATNANGCTSDTARTTVVVNPAVSPTVTINSSATNICTGTQVSFTATTSNPGNSPVYQWLLNGQKVGTNSPAYSSSSFVNNDSVRCVVTFTLTCGSGSATSNTIVLRVSPKVTPTFDTIGPLCQNSIPPALPLTSKEGIRGTWSPATINTSALGTIAYKFTPSAADSCSTPASINITIASSIAPTFPTISNSYCQNDTSTTLPQISKEGIHGTWSPSSINTTDVGRAAYTFTPVAGSCGIALQISITVNPLPGLIMGPDTTIAPGTSTTLNPSVTGNIVTYQWNPSTGLNDPTSKNPVASPSVTTVYTLNITDDKGCEASGTVKVTVSGTNSNIKVPNAFSPNGDGINDTWVIPDLSGFPGATVDVYNRYGQLVFHSENNNKNWDGTYNGKPLPMATYYYIIDPKNNEKKISGTVTIFK